VQVVGFVSSLQLSKGSIHTFAYVLVYALADELVLIFALMSELCWILTSEPLLLGSTRNAKQARIF